MTKTDFETKTFNELIEQLNEERNDIHDRETLKDVAKYFIDADDFYMTKHILDGVDDYAEWYWYNISMGTLDEVIAIKTKEDLKDFGFIED